MNWTVIEPTQLAEVITSEQRREAWTEADLRSILQHQLEAELVFDLTCVQGITDETVEMLMGVSPPRIERFGDLLAHPAPPMGLLELCKRFGKKLAQDTDQDLPREVGAALYYAAIAKALMLDQRITTLDTEALRTGLRWHADQPWITPELRVLMHAAADRVQAGR